MVKYGTWNPYAGSDAIILTVVLLIIAAILAYLGTMLRQPVGVDRPGKVVSAFLVVMWCLSLATFLIAVVTYVKALYQQYGDVNLPTSPVSPITALSGLASFVTIAYLSRHHGLKNALGSAIVGVIAAPMIFELPFDLIVAGRTYPPTPAAQYTLLFFLPLFLFEISCFSLLTLSPLTKLSKYTLFSLAAMFFVFAVWALFGFSYPSSQMPLVLNAVSKVLSFAAATTLFLPQAEVLAR